MRGDSTQTNRSAFTLVELLVVIGIIAILIAVLLPVLASARRSANAVKCAAEMKELWNAFLMYAGEYHDSFPVAQYRDTYSLGVTNYPYNYNTYVIYAHWDDFISKYVTKVKTGTEAQTDADQAQASRTGIWGCPSWDPYWSGSTMVHTGYGMNAFPTFTTQKLAAGSGGSPFATGEVDPSPAESAIWDPAKSPLPPAHGFFRRTAWSDPANRCLIADSIFWLVQSHGMASASPFPPQALLNNQVTWPASGETLIDWYRHGKYPPMGTIANTFSDKGGMVSYNILYCDGHVDRAVTKDVAYRATRMRFPG